MKYLMANDTAYDEMLAWKVDGCVPQHNRGQTGRQAGR